MARKDALLRLTSRLIARRDALRKALTAISTVSESSRSLNAVGDNVDAAVDSANDEICSQLVEIESRELGQIEHALAADRRRRLWPMRVLRRQDRRASVERTCRTPIVHRLPARERASRPVATAGAGIEAVGEGLRQAARRRRERLADQPERLRDGLQRDGPLIRPCPRDYRSRLSSRAAGVIPAAFF